MNWHKTGMDWVFINKTSLLSVSGYRPIMNHLEIVNIQIWTPHKMMKPLRRQCLIVDGL